MGCGDVMTTKKTDEIEDLNWWIGVLNEGYKLHTGIEIDDKDCKEIADYLDKLKQFQKKIDDMFEHMLEWADKLAHTDSSGNRNVHMTDLKGIIKGERKNTQG